MENTIEMPTYQDPRTYQHKHYLVIRPISEDLSTVEPYLESLSDITRLDKRTLEQKFVGTALQIIKVDHDQASLEKICRELKKDGLASAVIGKDDILKTKRPRRSSCIEISQNSIKFLSPTSEVLFSLNGTQRCLIVLATMNFEGLQKKRMARRAMNVNRSFSLTEILKYIYQNHPLMEMYTSTSDAPIRIDSTKFNYNCLGEVNRNSIALNFPVIIKEINRVSSSVVLDTGFGENELPFFNWSANPTRENFIRKFSTYSRFVFLAYQKELFTTSSEQSPLQEIPLIKDMSGIIWGGPLQFQKKPARQTQTKGEFPEEKAADRLPLPPPDKAVKSRYISIWPISFENSLKSYKRYIRSLGLPLLLLYPLIVFAFSSFGLSYIIERMELALFGFLSLGLILFFHSFILIKRKRIIENCPTSKIRSMPMGQVEINGYVKPKYYLKSPYSLIDCVYYSYKIYEEERTQDGYQYRLKECGNSGNIPFYVEDDTGKILVIPDEAIIHAGQTQTFYGDPLTKIFGGKSSCYSKKKIVETVIPIGRFLYILGFAHRLRLSSQEKKNTFVEKLRILKMDKNRLKKYDVNQDGQISQEEWDIARKDIEEELLVEQLASKRNKDHVAIDEHPSGGLFYISDKREEGILRSMSWEIPLFLILGIAGIIGAVFYLLKYPLDKAILLELKRLFW